MWFSLRLTEINSLQREMAFFIYKYNYSQGEKKRKSLNQIYATKKRNLKFFVYIWN